MSVIVDSAVRQGSLRQELLKLTIAAGIVMFKNGWEHPGEVDIHFSE